MTSARRDASEPSRRAGGVGCDLDQLHERAPYGVLLRSTARAHEGLVVRAVAPVRAGRRLYSQLASSFAVISGDTGGTVDAPSPGVLALVVAAPERFCSVAIATLRSTIYLRGGPSQAP
ncbi:MAG: hypothetical protein IPK80_01395 [Nannocystis sp.]|nr:hypothetical protein [Nannocystis sp.]